jgi:hypothetical protein
MSILLILIVFIFSTSAQIAYWPEVLHAPLEKVPEDSNNVNITAKQEINMGTYKTDNLFLLEKSDSVKQVNQKCEFTFLNDHNLDLQNYYLNLSGSVLKKRYPYTLSSLGLEWIPIAYLNRNKKMSRGSSLGSLYLGPVFAVDYLNMPIRLSGGGAIDVWPDSLPYSLVETHLSSFHGDKGFYGKINMGDNTQPLIESIPFYSQGSIFGKYMSEAGNSKVTSGEVNALFVQDIAFADTLFLYCADTLTKGRTAFFNEYGSTMLQFTNIPNKTINSLQAAIGIKNIGNLIFRPSLIYQFDLSTIKYAPNSEVLGDLLVGRNTVSAFVRNNSSKALAYSGGISVMFEDEDHLYKADLPKSIESSDINDLNDSLLNNSEDFSGYYSDMFHFLEYTFQNDMKLRYNFNIGKHHKESPNNYRVSGRTFGGNDNDRVNYKHLLEFTLVSRPNFSTIVLGEYIKDMNIFLKSEKSANNRRDWIYHVKATFLINTQGKIPLKESIGIIARTARYDYPEFQDLRLPPMSRNFYSRLNGIWYINELWNAEGYLNGIYHDDGYINWDNNIYNISDRRIEISGEAKVNRFLNDNFIIKFGSLGQILYYLDYDYNSTENYRIVLFPFVEMSAFIFNKLSLNTKIRYARVKNGNEYWEAFSYFNINF